MREQSPLRYRHRIRFMVLGKLLRGLVMVVLCLMVSTIVAGQDAASRKAGEVVIEKLSLTTPETGNVTFEIGTLYVPENRSDPKSRLIGLGFARFRALEATGAPPTFHLPGGPGGSYLRGLKQDNKQLSRQLKDIALYRRVGDVILVDQRGASERGEMLQFKYRTSEQPLDQPGSMARSTAAYVEIAKAAVSEYAKKGIDLRGYTVKECADDVNDLRKALGYEQITLVGQSFGSQWSFAIMRRHPQIVTRAILSGVEPIDAGYDMPSHIFAAMQRQWWAAEKAPRLQPYLPKGGIAQAVREIIRRLERPLQVSVKDEKSGQTLKVTLGRDDFRIFDPASILTIYHGKYEKWAQGVFNSRRSHEGDELLIGPLIDTSLGVTRLREHLLRTDAAVEFLGHWNFDSYLATAEIWPTPDVGDDFRNETVNRTPVLFVHGDWDTSTPVENLLHVLPFFINSRVLLVHQGFHGAYAQVREHLPDATAAVMEFARSGSTANLPVRVTVPAPAVRVPDFPPPASTLSSQSN
jgi:pimeloyl-ACP methyl ester carboxylesterase